MRPRWEELLSAGLPRDLFSLVVAISVQLVFQIEIADRR